MSYKDDDLFPHVAAEAYDVPGPSVLATVSSVSE